MNASILHPEIQEFIHQNLNTDLGALLLKGMSFEEVSAAEVVEQMEAKKKCKTKLPTWFHKANIYYPNKLNVEQTSSELTAHYKSTLIKGTSLIDLTGGFGVDASYFAKVFEEVIYCELHADLQDIVKHNLEVLNVKNIKTFNQDGLEHLSRSKKNYDWIYVDPSRRHESKGKVFFLEDCVPDIPQHLSLLWARSKNIMIKTAPLLDISIGIAALEYVKSIHVVAVNNDVKELLWILKSGYHDPVQIHTTNITKKGNQYFNFILEAESQREAPYSPPLNFLYEPNSAILKSGGFNILTTAHNVYKLHKHTHLYTSDDLIEFPGRTFKIVKSIPYNKKQIKNLSIKKANISTRNFPEKVENLRKIFKIKDGGTLYLFFITNNNDEKVLLLCDKIN